MQICSRGYWNPSVDHPNLLRPLTESERLAMRPNPITSNNPETLSDLIREELFIYAKRNLALVNVYIKDPVVTRIKRDQKIPLIGFVANTGGLLGLCMGFSLVSVAEILYHALVNVCNGCRGGVRKVRTMKARMVSAGGGERQHVDPELEIRPDDGADEAFVEAAAVDRNGDTVRAEGDGQELDVAGLDEDEEEEYAIESMPSAIAKKRRGSLNPSVLVRPNNGYPGGARTMVSEGAELVRTKLHVVPNGSLPKRRPTVCAYCNVEHQV